MHRADEHHCGGGRITEARAKHIPVIGIGGPVGSGKTALVERFPREFLKGLIHSDGCRATNKVRGANGDCYEYPRYFFTNHSDDIRELFTWACGLIGVDCRPNNRWNISVARRASVAVLDEFIGPKS